MRKIAWSKRVSGACSIVMGVILISGGARAQCPNAPPDSSFAPVAGTRFNLRASDGTSYGPDAQYNITRVVGPGTTGTNGELDPNGFLTNWSTDVANGVIGRSAYLNVKFWGPAYDGCVGTQFGCLSFPAAYAQGAIQLNVNGNLITPRVSSVNLRDPASTCLEFDSQYLKFPARAQVGSAPTPVSNTIGLLFNQPKDACVPWWVLLSIFPGGINTCLNLYTTWSPAAGLGNLTIKAMAPIVLVHGWNSGPWAWGPETPDPSGPCAAGQLSSDQGRATINTLKNAKAPFDCSIHIDRQASITKGAVELRDGVARISPSVAQVAATFGARHAHIITHSKGGLFTRAFLDMNAGLDPSTQTGIISVTTLDTPHHGSILADTAVLYTQGVRSVLPGYARAAYLFGQLFAREQLSNAFGPGNDDLRIGKVEGFNATHPTPPSEYHMQMRDASGRTFNVTIGKPQYYSTSGNADLNGDRTLQDNEAAPYVPADARFRWNRIGKVLSFIEGRDSQGRITATAYSPTFPDNDLAVSIDSARSPGFKQIGAYRANHASILCPGAGLIPNYCLPITNASPVVDALGNIRQAEQGLNEEIR